MKPLVIAALLCLALAGQLHGDGSEPISLEQYQNRLEALLSSGRDFNPNHAVRVQIDQCRITWRHELLTRSCSPNWSSPAITKSIDLNDFKITQRVNDSMGVALYAPLGEISTGLDGRLQVGEPISSIDQLFSLGVLDGRSVYLEELCDGTVAHRQNQRIQIVALHGNAADEFENILTQIADVNGCEGFNGGPKRWWWPW